MRIAVAQCNFHVGNFGKNLEKICGLIDRANSVGADLVIFPEMAVCGYPPRDLLGYNGFIRQCESAIEGILKHSDGIAVIAGSPSRNLSGSGKNLFNSAYFLHGRNIRAVIHKTLLPDYDIFDEQRYFQQNEEVPQIIDFKGQRIALTICEDIWSAVMPGRYKTCPMDRLVPLRPTLAVNISASPFDYAHREERIRMLKENAAQYKIPFIYVNHVGGQNSVLFDGGSMVMDKDGEIVDELRYFEEELRYFDVDGTTVSPAGQTAAQIPGKTERIRRALVMGIRDFFSKTGFNKAVLGLSGGIDSSVAAALAAEALGSGNVHGLLMPSPFSSPGSVTDAQAVAENLGIGWDKIPISKLYEEFTVSLEPWFRGTDFGVAEENIQPRIRATLLMAFANKQNRLLLNTSNKSEIATGYGTLYGDMAGGLSVLGDVYKTEVYELAALLNRDRQVIPDTIIKKIPSAELRPGQKDTDTLPEYPLLDKILFQHIEQKKNAEEITATGFDKATVENIIRMVMRSEHKRYQCPPVLRVSPKAFGIGRRMPLEAGF